MNCSSTLYRPSDCPVNRKFTGLLPSFKNIFPAQHGAWAVFVSGLIIGFAGGGGFGIKGALFAIAAINGFLFRHAAGRALKEHLTTGALAPDKMVWTVIFLSLFSITGAVLLFYYQLWMLITFGFLAGLLILLTLYMELKRKHLSASGELLGMLSLSIVIPASYYVTNETVDTTSCTLWLSALFLYAGSVFHVRYLVRGRNVLNADLSARTKAAKETLLLHTGGLATAVILSAGNIIPPLVPVAFILPVARAYIAVFKRWKKVPPLKHIGYSELFHTIVFTVLILITAT